MESYDVSKFKPNATVESIVDVLCKRVQNPDRNFFTILICYHLTKLASMMNVRLDGKGFGDIIINNYSINAAPSGFGKDYATNIIEQEIVHLFYTDYREITFPMICKENMEALANERVIKNDSRYMTELEAITAEFQKAGGLLTSFDSATTPGVKVYRNKLLLGSIGSLNLEMNELGNNLLNNKELFDIFLELYEGVIRPKLIKGTKDDARSEEILGKVPSNMLLYGTPTSLCDGASVEQLFMSLLTVGYARRCLFGYSSVDYSIKNLTLEERIEHLKAVHNDNQLEQIAIDLRSLADPINHKLVITISDDVIEHVIRYQMHCEKMYSECKSSDEIRRAEYRGRYYKALKLAGAFAFIENSVSLNINNWEAAVIIVEQSGKCFNQLLKTDPIHVRLCKYLAECRDAVTLAELVEELSYFPKQSSSQKDLIKLAIAHGHKNNIIVKRSIIDDIEFYSGEALVATDLNNLIVSYTRSPFIGASSNYINTTTAGFDKLPTLFTLADGHWCNHCLVDGNRKEIIRGFNLIVLDIDGLTPLTAAIEMLKSYTYHIYTTKSHKINKNTETDACDRYRIVLPTNFILKLSQEEYKEFMNNIFEFLPFESDEQTGQANRKWLSNPNALLFSNEGQLFDVLPFIPKTKKNEERKQVVKSIGSLDALESYFYQLAYEGNRNNTLFRYGATLFDSGCDIEDIIDKVTSFNKKLPNPISNERLESTVIKSITAKYYAKSEETA